MKAWAAAFGVMLLGSAVLSGDLSRADAQPGARPPKPDAESSETRSGTAAQKQGGAEPDNQQGAQIQKRQGPNSCDVRFINDTPWYINRVYIDGRRVGSLARGYSVSTWYDESTGETRLYAEADFTNGSTRSWGPYTFVCRPSSTFTWRLY